MKITFFERTKGACDIYRATQPLTLIKERGLHDVKVISPSEFAVAMRLDDAGILGRILAADVIVLPRLWGRGCFPDLKELNPRAKIVLEYDDDLFNVSPFNPAYAEHGVENVEISLQGERIKLWEDGQNINLAANKKSQGETMDAMGQADLITTTTEILAERLRNFNPNVAVLPNCVDLNMWKRLPLQPRAGLRMGWFGGHSHYEDWTLLAPVLPRIMAQFPDLTLVLFGAKFDGTLKGIPKERIEYHKWEEFAAYPYKAAILDLDLALIPLRDNAFNSCKSAIKFVEFGALKVPSVVSFVSPYKEIATEHNAMWIEDNSPDAWVKGIRCMLEDPLLRTKTGLEAHQTVRNHFDIAQNYKLWAKAYEEVLRGSPSRSDGVIAHI